MNDARGESPFPRLPPYQFQRLLGRGAMGEVWLARQTEPLRRDVAIKFVRADWGSPEVAARLRNEAQTLARMDHPGIARVLDAGRADDERPYFVMEYVEGPTLTVYCDQRRLGVADRLRLFVRVCRAAHHAHQRGVVHRDLKPNNILVSDASGEATPKVIDFGIAKLLVDQAADSTARTLMGQVIGTPMYMSPEQASAGEMDIDTRADVYSLGVVLYELLVGRTPFEPAELDRVAHLEKMRLIREVDPPLPSRRITTLGADADAIASSRGSSLRALRSELHGDLDWIVLRAMEKDRRRRYASAEELALDLERHLRDEPVVARPPSVLYRTGRYLRRHRTGAMAAAFAVLLMGGLWIGREFFPAQAGERPVVTGSARRITVSGRAEIPLWSPDGSMIAYTERPFTEMRIVNPAGEFVRSFRFPEGGGVPWAWVNEGQQILAHRWNRQTRKMQIDRIDLATDTLELMVENARFPAMSHDGSLLAFAAHNPAGGGINGTIDLLDLRTGERRVVSRAEEPGTAVYKPVFTPDGTRLVYTRWNGTGHEFWVATIDGTHDRKIDVSPLQPGGRSAVSPDGRYIITGAELCGISSVWQIEIDGAERIPLTEGGTTVNHVTQAPDGQRVTFSRTQYSSRLVLVDAQSGTEHPPIRMDVDARHPTFAHDGRSLYFQALANGMWQIWQVDLEGATSARPAVTTSDMSCFAPVRGEKGILHLRGDLPNRNIFGRIQWQQQLWQSTPNGGSEQPWPQAGDLVWRIAAGGERSGRVLYTRNVGNQEVLCVADRGGPARVVAQDNDDYEILEFDWGRTGDEVIVLTSRSPENTICIERFELETGRSTPIATDLQLPSADEPLTARYCRSLVTSPDGRSAALLVVDPAQSSSSIYTCALDTGELELLSAITDEHLGEHLAWSPDGAELVLTLSRISTDVYVWEPREATVLASRSRSH